jgi:hypothetical protein
MTELKQGEGAIEAHRLAYPVRPLLVVEAYERMLTNVFEGFGVTG